MCSISITGHPNKRNHIISLSIFYKRDNDFKIENFYWPKNIKGVKKQFLNNKETFKNYNGQIMKSKINHEKKISDVDGPVFISNFINEPISQVMGYLEKRMEKQDMVFLHSADVKKWLKPDVLRKIDLKQICTVDVDYETSPLCNRKREHNAITCTMCKCFNVYKNRRFFTNVFRASPEFLKDFAISRRLISKSHYKRLSEKIEHQQDRNGRNQQLNILYL